MKGHEYRSRFGKLSTRVAAALGLGGALACFIIVAIGGSFPTYKHGTSIVIPRNGDVWQVGELHTVQWTLNDVSSTKSSGENTTAMFILSYTSGSPNSHVLLGHLTDWFPISDRLANIMVPSVPTQNDYSLYMFSCDNHDVSSWSGSITIFNPDDVDGNDQPPSSLDFTAAPPINVTMSLTSTFSDSDLTTLSDTATSLASSTSGADGIVTFTPASLSGSVATPLSGSGSMSSSQVDRSRRVTVCHRGSSTARIASTRTKTD